MLGRGQGHQRGVTFALSLAKVWVGIFSAGGRRSGRQCNVGRRRAEKGPGFHVCDLQRVHGALPGAVVQDSCVVTAQLCVPGADFPTTFRPLCLAVAKMLPFPCDQRQNGGQESRVLPAPNQEGVTYSFVIPQLPS